jgi:multiple sugar transport system substrate-binding protein
MRIIVKRLFPLLLILLLLAPNLAAQDVVTIKWWTVPSEEFSEEAQRGLAEQFMAEHPNIVVELTVLPPDGYDERMNTVIGAGSGVPDVALFWNANWWPQTLDLTPFLEADEEVNPDIYFPEFFNNWGVWQDKVVGLPLGVGANFVMYNKDVFDAAGVEYPAVDWTPDDFIRIATELTSTEERRWGGDRPRGPYRAIWMNYGAFPYSEDSTTVDGYFNSPESVEAYTWLWDLVNSGATPTQADIEILGTEGTGPFDLFVSGRLAMATLNQGHMLNSIELGVNFGIVPEPSFPDNPQYVNAWSLTVSIWSGTEHPEEAWEFLRYWAGPEGQRYLMENANLFPSIPDVLADYEYADTDYAQAFFSVLEDIQVAKWTNAHPCWRGAVIRAVQDSWDLIMLGEIAREEVEATLTSLVEPAQVALDECVARLGG